MSGATDLGELLKGMEPVLDEQSAFVFLTVPHDLVASSRASVADITSHHAIATFREAEGLTVVVPDTFFDDHVLSATGTPTPVSDALREHWRSCAKAEKPPRMSHITMRIHSSLSAVGFTAAFSRVLTDAGISCNVFAGYYHDHIFVPVERSADAISTLTALAAASSQ
ncbi:ACT domain containing protein [Novymonas esmeraldas]|uniref:ACT domain containing protein n=1 Tax=Novymonas esmeraldas TaxID=1808958 RepID=A0AAW0EWK4_9TRYP